MSAIENTRVTEEEEELFRKVLQLSLDFMNANYNREEPIVLFRTPNELNKEINIPIAENGVGFQEIWKEIEQTVKYCVRTGHIRFFNQLWAGTDKAAVIGEWLTAVLNASMYTYEVSPVFSLMEIYILRKLRGIVGWPEEKGDGVFAPGGANCNLLAVLAARNHLNPDLKNYGFSQNSAPLVAFTSNQSHYTIKRAASVIGIGFKGVVEIECDSAGKMKVEVLEKEIEKAISEGKKPFFINATAGSTVLGAYDHFTQIAQLAKKHNIWLHIDACWGGHCLLSKKYRHLMDGCQLADSIAWTATKCIGLPQQCSVILTREPNILTQCNAMNQDYLFHEHEQKDFDLGEKTLNCGRRVDAFKLWVSWKVYGDLGYEKRVDHAFSQAEYFTSILLERKERFQVLHSPESLNVCFWFVPPSARALPLDSKERWEKMDHATLSIRKQIQNGGKVLVNYSDLPGVHGHFFRMITCNPNATKDDMRYVIDLIEQLGQGL